MIYLVEAGKLVNRPKDNFSTSLVCPMCRCVNCPGNPCDRTGYTDGK